MAHFSLLTAHRSRHFQAVKKIRACHLTTVHTKRTNSEETAEEAGAMMARVEAGMAKAEAVMARMKAVEMTEMTEMAS